MVVSCRYAFGDILCLAHGLRKGSDWVEALSQPPTPTFHQI